MKNKFLDVSIMKNKYFPKWNDCISPANNFRDNIDATEVQWLEEIQKNDDHCITSCHQITMTRVYFHKRV